MVTEYHVGAIGYCPDVEFDNAGVIVGKADRHFRPDETTEFLNRLQRLSKLPLIISVE